VAADGVVLNVDAETALGSMLGRPARPPRERSLSGLALMLGLRGTTPGLAHHTIHFPADYAAEFRDIAASRPPQDPTLYVSAPCVTDPADAPEGGEGWFVLANAPAGADEGALEAAAARIVDRLGVRDRVAVEARRTPADLERETGAVGGAIYGAAPNGRLGTLGRPGNRVPGIRNAWLVGGSVHPGGGLPLVMLGGATVARMVGSAG
jgi:phytoene dehydrogenase-like protein